MSYDALDEFLYPEDEPTELDRLLTKAEWVCAKCKITFTDPEDLPEDTQVSTALEPRLYWLSITESVCSNCAAAAGIPPLDKE
jgi:hypothetical protein